MVTWIGPASILNIYLGWIILMGGLGKIWGHLNWPLNINTNVGSHSLLFFVFRFNQEQKMKSSVSSNPFYGFICWVFFIIFSDIQQTLCWHALTKRSEPVSFVPVEPTKSVNKQLDTDKMLKCALSSLRENVDAWLQSIFQNHNNRFIFYFSLICCRIRTKTWIHDLKHYTNLWLIFGQS